MKTDISRRSFIKAGAIAVGTAAASGVPKPRTAFADDTNELCTLFDLSKCIGCEACVEACRDINGNKFPKPQKPFPQMAPVERVPVADWSTPEKREVMNRLTPYNWLFIQRAQGIYESRSFNLNIPRRCMHCRNAPCVNMCPFGAAFKQDNGIVRIHPDVCMGGAKCKKVCPWLIPERQTGVGTYLNLMPNYAGNGVMFKCDRCFDRVAQGELPACIEACPKQVQQIGPRDEILAQAHQLAKETKGYLYGETENGGTNTIYVSPVPFEVLNTAIQKGPGTPHLQRVTDAMLEVNNLAWALVIAPIAGIFAAVVRQFNKPGNL